MFIKTHRKAIIGVSALIAIASIVLTAGATHSWGGYHWARTANPFTLKLGDNLSSNWDPYLTTTSNDWSVVAANSFGFPGVLNTLIVPGSVSSKNCKSVLGMVQVCNSRYGNNGWLGIAGIAASGSHITQGYVKMNDTYFSTAKYDTPAWRRLVLCQEVGHTLGLDHQDTNFYNTNLGTCMDYTNDPDGTLASLDQLSNEYPNAHDYDELALIYSHLDTTTTVSASTLSGKYADINESDPKEWGKEIRKSKDGRASLFERDFGGGHKLFTFVFWAK